MTGRRFSQAEIDDIKARNPVTALAGALVTLRAQRRAGMTHVGPCPICSANANSRAAGRFECNDDKWVCAVCQDGGDQIKLAALLNNLDPKRDFMRVVELLGGARKVDAEVAAARAAERERKRRRQEEAAAQYRERERQRLYELFWRLEREDGSKTRVLPWQATPVETYLAGRGLAVPPGARLRFHPNMPLFADGREREPRLLHSGPAMLAAILLPDAADRGVERFSGLHITWLDPQGPKGKVMIVDPETGEIVPSKKVRGHKAGGFIDLGTVRQTGEARPCARLFAGEGIETVLTIYTALLRAGRLREGDAFRSGVDLGNLAGRALDRLPHPTFKTEVRDKATGAVKARRTLMVPGREPDLDSPAMPVPASVRELVLLGDADSDPFTTQCAMARAAKRRQRAERIHGAPSGASASLSPADSSAAAPVPRIPGAAARDNFSEIQVDRVVRVIWPRPGLDFNDMLQGGK